MGKKKAHPYSYLPEKESYFHHSAFQLEIKESQIPNAGKGVFTSTAIPNGSCIDLYYGISCRYPMSKYFISLENESGIDAGNFPRCYTAMINDVVGSQFTINCEFIISNQTVSVYACKDITPGEELFISYGDEYWK